MDHSSRNELLGYNIAHIDHPDTLNWNHVIMKKGLPESTRMVKHKVWMAYNLGMVDDGLIRLLKLAYLAITIGPSTCELLMLSLEEGLL